MSVQGTILVLDGVSTNRIMLKVQLTAAWYHVVQGEKLDGLGPLLRRIQPDLVLTAMTLPDGDAASVKKMVLSDPALRDVPVVAIAPHNNKTARLQALSAGLDDVLATPFNDTLLLARVRSLLRARAEIQDLRDIRNPQTVGFGEAPMALISPACKAQIAVLTRNAKAGTLWRTSLMTQMPHTVQCHTFPNLSGVLSETIPDVIVMDLGLDQSGLNILADLKSRMGTRRTALIAIIDEDNATVAVDALDRGADAVCLGGFCADEVSLRIKALLARKAYNDDLRAKYRRGLEESWIDPLTGLNNRRYAISAMDQLMQCAEHRGHSFAVMLADLDHFKSINDHFGHTNGDRVLIEAANRMKLAFGTDGFVSRIGGEEFLFGMPDAPREKAMRKAAEVRRKVCGEPIVLPDISARLTVTVSIGLKVCDPPFPNQTTGRISTDNLMKCADKALYTAKKAGRNRVRLGLSAA